MILQTLYKEHVAITIFASTAADSALTISIFAADELFYDIQPNAGVGIGLGGIMRSFLVYSPTLYFPTSFRPASSYSMLSIEE